MYACSWPNGDALSFAVCNQVLLASSGLRAGQLSFDPDHKLHWINWCNCIEESQLSFWTILDLMAGRNEQYQWPLVQADDLGKYSISVGYIANARPFKDNTVEPWYKDHLWAAAKVVFIVRWSLYWGGRGWDHGWTGCTKCGLYSKVVSIPRWSLTKVRL